MKNTGGTPDVLRVGDAPVEALSTAVEKPDDCTGELRTVVTKADVGRYFALMLGVELTTFKVMVKAKKKCEQQAPAVGPEGA